MKNVLIAILISSKITFLRSDTITYTKSGLFGEDIYSVNNVSYIGISNQEVFFYYLIGYSNTKDNKITSKAYRLKNQKQVDTVRFSLPCEKVMSIEDENGELVEFDCYLDSSIEKDMVQLENKKNNVIKFGGAMIMLGSGMLYYSLEQDCKECDPEELESFMNDSNNRNKIAYILITLGGFLIMIGG